MKTRPISDFPAGAKVRTVHGTVATIIEHGRGSTLVSYRRPGTRTIVEHAGTSEEKVVTFREPRRTETWSLATSVTRVDTSDDDE